MFRQFLLFCLIGVVSSPLAQTPAQQLLQNGIFKIVLLAEDKEVLLADKVEFDSNGNSLFFINRKDAAIEFREQAWRWVGQAQDEVLQLDLSSKNRFDISFKRLDDKILEGDVSKKSSGYQELVRLLGKDPQEMKIRFYKLLFNPRTNRNQTLQGKWQYANLSDEFMLADAYLLRDYFVLLKNPELLEISDDLKGKPFYTLKVANSTQGNYLRVVNTNTKKASVHFVSGLSQTNLFLTSGQEGEIKNMHLKKVEEQDEKGIAFRFYHKKGVPIPVVSHRSYNLIQEVEKWDNGVVYVKRKNIPLPEKIEGAYPLVFSSVSIKEMYTKSGVYVNADHPEIKAFTAEIMKGKTFSNQHELVKYVISQCASRLCYGDSELIPNASDALKKGVANCIGYTHLPAAVLRNLGVPTRNVRVYNTLPVQSAKMNGMESSGSFALWEKNRLPWVPHYILEVYYPSLGQWVSFDPQTSLKQVSLASVVLYDAVDWDMTKHRSSRPFATDQNLMILGADHFTDKRLRDQLPLLTRFESEEVTIAEGPLTSVFTKDDSDAIAGVFYQSTTGKLIPMIRDEDDPTKWSLYFSSLKIENTYYKPGDIMKLSGTGIQIVDKYGTVMSYNQFMGPEYGKIQFALDLVLYKSTLSNCKLVDSKTGLLHYAFCGDDIFVFDKHKQSPSAALKHSFNFSLHARRGVFLDISPKTAGMASFSIKVDLAKDGKTVRIGDIEFALVKESLCH